MRSTGVGAGSSTHPVPSIAVGEAVGEVLERVGSHSDLVIVFATPDLTGTLEEMLGVVRAVLKPKVLLGCTAASVFANGVAIENRQGVSIWAGQVGESVPFVLEASESVAADEEPDIRSSTDLDAAAEGASALLVFGDPYSFPAERWLRRAQERWPGLPVVGGLASAASGPGGNRFSVNERVLTGGAIGLFFKGPTDIETVISQGCRPLGQAFTVTLAERNVIYELGGISATGRLDAIVAGLSESERRPLRAGVHLGLVINEHQLDFDRGDFLIRSVLGADRSRGALAVDSEVPVGTTVQFHSRDDVSAAIDLEERVNDAISRSPVRGVLLFSCTGRGPRLFSGADHDAQRVYGLATAPLGGMACRGEFGSVAGANLVHTFSASMALFR